MNQELRDLLEPDYIQTASWSYCLNPSSAMTSCGNTDQCGGRYCKSRPDSAQLLMLMMLCCSVQGNMKANSAILHIAADGSEGF